MLWFKILFIKLTNCSKHSLILAKIGIEVHLMHEFLPLEPILAFQQRTCPIHYFRSKTHVFECFSPFRRRTRPVAETSIGVHLIECFRIVGLQTYYLKDFNALLQVQNSHFGYFHTIWCSTMSLWFRTTYFASKTRVSGGFTPFRCRT